MPAAPQPTELIQATAVFLVREHGLLDAKAMVANDVEVRRAQNNSTSMQ